MPTPPIMAVLLGSDTPSWALTPLHVSPPHPTQTLTPPAWLALSSPLTGCFSQVYCAPKSCTALYPHLTAMHGYPLHTNWAPKLHNRPNSAWMLSFLLSLQHPQGLDAPTPPRTTLRPGCSPHPIQATIPLPTSPPTQQFSSCCLALLTFFCHSWRGPC